MHGRAAPARLAPERGEHVVPISGTRSVERLEENAAAVDIEVDYEDVERLDRIDPRGAAAGLRYPEPAMQALNR